MNIDKFFNDIKDLFTEWKLYDPSVDITIKDNNIYFTVKGLPMLNGGAFVITRPLDRKDFRFHKHDTIHEISIRVTAFISAYAKYHQLATEIRSEYFESDKYDEELKTERYMAIVSTKKDYRFISKYCSNEVEALLRAYLLYLKAKKEGLLK